MVRRLLDAITREWRGLLRHRPAAHTRNGPVDHADLKRLIELSRDCDVPIDLDGSGEPGRRQTAFKRRPGSMNVFDLNRRAWTASHAVACAGAFPWTRGRSPAPEAAIGRSC